jgi:synaptobrevin family protein YKT6
VEEFMTFFCKTIVERTIPASRQSVKEGEYMCHVYVRADNLAGVVISDHEYPTRVSHTLITKILDEFSQKVPAANWPNLTERDVAFPQLNSYLAKYQNPREADAMTKIQEDLDETKIILVITRLVCWMISKTRFSAPRHRKCASERGKVGRFGVKIRGTQYTVESIL